MSATDRANYHPLVVVADSHVGASKGWLDDGTGFVVHFAGTFTKLNYNQVMALFSELVANGSLALPEKISKNIRQYMVEELDVDPDFLLFMRRKGIGDQEARGMITTAQRLRAIQQEYEEHSQKRPSTRPEDVTEKWNTRTKRDVSPVQFIQDNYGEWLGKGLTRADIGQLDPQLYTALAHWLRKNDLPDGFGLDNAKKGKKVEGVDTDTWVERIRQADRDGTTTSIDANTKIINRLARALVRGKDTGQGIA